MTRGHDTREAEILASLSERLKAERQKTRRRRRRIKVLLAVVGGLLVLAAIPYLIGQFQPDPEARRQQALITAGLEQVEVGMTLPEVNRLFDGMHTPPRTSIALHDSRRDESVAFTATAADGSELRFAFAKTIGALDFPYLAVVVFPRSRVGPPPTFIVFSTESSRVLAVVEVECARAMQIVSDAPKVPEEAYQEAPIRPKRNELIHDSMYEFWMTGRAFIADGAAAALRCVPSES